MGQPARKDLLLASPTRQKITIDVPRGFGVDQTLPREADQSVGQGTLCAALALLDSGNDPHNGK